MLHGTVQLALNSIYFLDVNTRSKDGGYIPARNKSTFKRVYFADSCCILFRYILASNFVYFGNKE